MDEEMKIEWAKREGKREEGKRRGEKSSKGKWMSRAELHLQKWLHKETSCFLQVRLSRRSIG